MPFILAMVFCLRTPSLLALAPRRNHLYWAVPSAIDIMGNKGTAKRLMIEAGFLVFLALGRERQR